jgi:hypothetical protein
MDLLKQKSDELEFPVAFYCGFLSGRAKPRKVGGPSVVNEPRDRVLRPRDRVIEAWNIDIGIGRALGLG